MVSSNAERWEGDAVDFLLEQHSDARELLSRLHTSTPPDPHDLQLLVALLAVHETAEEMVIYPTFRDIVPSGDAVADARLAEEDRLKKLLAGLESMDIAHTSFAGSIETFMTEFDAHASTEEQTVFPALRQHADATQMNALFSELVAAEAAAPTRAHRMSPESGLGNLLIGPFLSIVDRFRDAIRSRRHGSTR
jgi:hemerythrin superfamily protein